MTTSDESAAGPTPDEMPPADAAAAPAAADTGGQADALTERGIALCRKARWRDAIDPLRRSTELAPNEGLAFYYLGEAYNHTDQLPAALSAFETAAQLLSENWRALKGVGIVLDRMRRPQEAAAAYQKARDAQRK